MQNLKGNEPSDKTKLKYLLGFGLVGAFSLLGLIWLKKKQNQASIQRNSSKILALRFYQKYLLKKAESHKEVSQKKSESTQSLVQEIKKKQEASSDSAATIKTNGILKIIFGTTSGNASKLAHNLSHQARKHNFIPHVVHLGDFQPDLLKQTKLAVFCLATYGDGGPTEDAEKFATWLQDPSRSKQQLKSLQYSVFGLGNSVAYPNFAQMSVDTDRRLEEIGAERIYQLGKGDAGKESTQTDFALWQKNLWEELKRHSEPFESTLEQIRESELYFKVFVRKNEEGKEKIGENLFEVNQVYNETELAQIEKKGKARLQCPLVRVKNIRELRQNTDEGSCVEICLDISENKEMKYTTAANFAIFPENNQQIVEEFAKQQGYDLNSFVLIEGKNSETKVPLPSPITVRTYLTMFCDLLGRLSKNSLFTLAQFANSESDRAYLETLSSLENYVAFDKEISDKKHCVLSLCEAFNLQIPLPNLIGCVSPPLQRSYTISSSSLKNPTEIRLTVSMLVMKDYKNTQRLGTASYYFCDLFEEFMQNPDQPLFVRGMPQPSLFTLPKDDRPVIMVGPGAGIAPFIAFCEEKEYFLGIGDKKRFGKFTLYFGCRKAAEDYVYQEEIAHYAKSGVINNLRVALSREQKEKVYVQNLISEDQKKVAQIIFKQNGTIYLCGSEAMGQDVITVIDDIAAEYLDLGPLQSAAYIEQMVESGKFLKEIFT